MKKLCFDLDGVICTTTNADYKNSKPKKKIIELINNLYSKNYIIVFTARYMGRSKENIRLAKKKGYKSTLKQLKKWNLKFHKLKFGKPTYDIIVDDKSFDFKNNWYLSFKKKFK
jgi:hypothetical protein|tara:strand:- start:105 stop:446 length:342 start_codon:yes stop_codon:yes gene_type:complete